MSPQAGIKSARRNINNLTYADDTTLMAESEKELKSCLMRVKEESEKDSLKLNIWKNKIMASGPITSWQIDGEKAADFLFLGSKITADGDCSHEIKRFLLLGRKAMTNIALPTKVHIVKALFFPVIYGSETRTIKKAERWRIDAFELWCWKRLLKVPWTARRTNQLVIKEISPEFSLEGLMLKFQYFGHLAKNWLIWMAPDAGKDWGQEEKGMTADEMIGWCHWLNGCEFEQALGDGDGQGSLACCSPWGHKESGTTEQLN